MTQVSALPVVVPFLAGALLVGIGGLSPRLLRDGIAVATALGAVALCAVLLLRSA
jgi:formate hydrogenlyase subunit 3/multisubunit Na+/H+ antiporter MnhD subunit